MFLLSRNVFLRFELDVFFSLNSEPNAIPVAASLQSYMDFGSRFRVHDE